MASNPYQTMSGGIYATEEWSKLITSELRMSNGESKNLSKLDTDPYTGRPAKYPLYLIKPNPGSPFTFQLKHPLFIDVAGEGKICVVDGRGFVRTAKPGEYREDRPFVQDDYRTVSKSDFIVEVGRGYLSMLHELGQGQPLMSLGDLPVIVYGSWLSSRIDRNLQLNTETKILLTQLAAYFYICLAHGRRDFTDTKAQHFKEYVARLFYTDNVIPEDVGHIGNLVEFISVLQSSSNQAVRLEGLSPKYIMEEVGGTWKGNLHRELVNTALEHPPTWLAILERTIEEASFYKKMPLGELVNYHARGRQRRGDEFIRSLRRLKF